MKAFLKTEWSKLRLMTFTEKRHYIWEYYKIQIFMFVLFSVATGGLLNTMVFNPQPSHYLYISWIEAGTPERILTALERDLDVIAAEADRHAVRVVSYALTGNSEMDMALQARFAAMLMVGEMDMLIFPAEQLEMIAEEWVIAPVHEVLDEVERINPALRLLLDDQARTITFRLAETMDEYEIVTDTMAFSLADSQLLASHGLDAANLYVGIVRNSSRIYASAKALEVLFE